MRTVQVEYLRPGEIVAERERFSVVYLPIGPLEWHGPAMPYGTDPLMAQEVARAAARITGGVVMPTLYVGTERERPAYILEGMGFEDLGNWVEEDKQNLCRWFTVDDLMFLKRGGRVSAATALVGTMLQIKPVLHVDDEGKLINVAKARGRKASLEALAKKVGETGLPGANDTVFISHGDCIEDVQVLEGILKEKYGVKKVFTYYVGAVIGSHAGPGTVALFFLGNKR